MSGLGFWLHPHFPCFLWPCSPPGHVILPIILLPLTFPSLVSLPRTLFPPVILFLTYFSHPIKCQPIRKTFFGHISHIHSMCIWMFLSVLSVCEPLACLVSHGGQKRGDKKRIHGTLWLELQIVVSYHVGPGNQFWALWENSQGYQPLRHLSSLTSWHLINKFAYLFSQKPNSVRT